MGGTSGLLQWGMVVVASAVAAGLLVCTRRGARGTAAVLAGLALAGAAAGATAWSRVSGQRQASRAGLLEAVPEHPLPGDSFVTSGTCRACHPSQHATWHRSFHRTMTQVATPETVLGDFGDPGPDGGVRLSSRGRDYRLWREGRELFVEMVDPEWEHDLLAQGRDPGAEASPPVVTKRIVMTTGSHHMQTYWVAGARDGRLFNVPFTWLNEDRRWAPREDVFLRPPDWSRQFGTWHDNCIECHSTAGEPTLDPATGTFDPAAAELGIACEACHGPGEEHVRINADPARRLRMHLGDEPDPTIVNPARLDSVASTQVCAQCHSMNAFKSDPKLPGKRYRAGGDLLETRIVLRTSDRAMTDAEKPDWPVLSAHLARQGATFLDERFWKDGMVRVSGRENNGMTESACFAPELPGERGDLSCLTCHSMHDGDPVDQLAPGREGDEPCLDCHASYRELAEEHSHHEAGTPGASCLNCHMPYTTYGLLKTIRSHQIDSPTVRSSVETGRPNACSLCHLDRPLGWAADWLARRHGQERPALTPDQETVAAGVLWALTGDAGQRAIVACALGWEPAQEASGRDWQAPYLGHLLADPYAVVRYAAHRSLRTLPGFEDFRYDFVGPADERSAARQRAVASWAGSRREPGRRAVLIDGQGRLDPAELTRLSRLRDDRPVDLRE